MSKKLVWIYSDIHSCNFVDTNIFGHSFASKFSRMSHSVSYYQSSAGIFLIYIILLSYHKFVLVHLSLIIQILSLISDHSITVFPFLAWHWGTCQTSRTLRLWVSFYQTLLLLEFSHVEEKKTSNIWKIQSACRIICVRILGLGRRAVHIDIVMIREKKRKWGKESLSRTGFVIFIFPVTLHWSPAASIHEVRS